MAVTKRYDGLLQTPIEQEYVDRIDAIVDAETDGTPGGLSRAQVTREIIYAGIAARENRSQEEDAGPQGRVACASCEDWIYNGQRCVYHARLRVFIHSDCPMTDILGEDVSGHTMARWTMRPEVTAGQLSQHLGTAGHSA